MKVIVCKRKATCHTVSKYKLFKISELKIQNCLQFVQNYGWNSICLGLKSLHTQLRSYELTNSHKKNLFVNDSRIIKKLPNESMLTILWESRLLRCFTNKLYLSMVRDWIYVTLCAIRINYFSDIILNISFRKIIWPAVGSHYRLSWLLWNVKFLTVWWLEKKII